MRFDSKNLIMVLFPIYLSLSVLISVGYSHEKALFKYPIQPVALIDIEIKDSFWKPRLEINSAVSIPHCFKQCEETGRIDNFSKAAHLLDGSYEGLVWWDSDVYKIIEAASYSLSLSPDPKLSGYLALVLKIIAAAQEKDGYLYTPRTIDPRHTCELCGKTRWSHRDSHELFNAGHLYEAAVAYYQATGKSELLKIAINNADLMCSVFGQDKKFLYNHPEIELALIKLYQVTGEEKYLQLSKYFIDNSRYHFGAGRLDDQETDRQYEALNHIVCATYMYCAMTDFMALQADSKYSRIMESIWENIVSKKLYLTGGIGSSGEGFGGNYILPNSHLETESPPSVETCGAIGYAFWNHRLFQLHGDSKYIDVLERILYNCFLATVSLDGRAFFYANPLAHDGKFPFNMNETGRKEWLWSACCPTNAVRFFPQIPRMIYAQKDDRFFVNLFIGSETSFNVKDTKVRLSQKTNYPWDGRIEINLEPDNSIDFSLCIRIPGWAKDQPVPSDLYRYLDYCSDKASIQVNGKTIELELEKGFAVIHRHWQKSDKVVLELPMTIRRVICHENVKNNNGKVALERGPIVYCAEGEDNGGKALNIVLPDDSKLQGEYRKDMLNGAIIIKGQALINEKDSQQQVQAKKHDLIAIPYYSWLNRGLNEMSVWFYRKASFASP